MAELGLSDQPRWRSTSMNFLSITTLAFAVERREQCCIHKTALLTYLRHLLTMKSLMNPSQTTTKKLAEKAIWLAFAAGWINLFANDILPRLRAGYDFTKDYGITEWLINFEGGFVRRGLLGAILHEAWTHLGINPIPIILLICIILYGIYCVYLITRARGLSPSWLLPSTLLAGAPLFMNDIVRKDVLLLLWFAILVRAATRKAPLPARIIAVNCLIISGTMFHELFAFLAIPAAVLSIASGLQRSKELNTRNLLQAFLYIIPSLILFLLVMRTIGDQDTALIVHNSWKELGSAAALKWPEQPGGSIMWLGANTAETVKMVLGKHLSRFLGIPALIWLALNILVGYTLLTSCLAQNSRQVFSRFFGLQLASLSPLFIIAVDSGRFAMLAFSSAFILFIEHRRLQPNTMPSSGTRVKPFYFRHLRLCPSALPICLLFYGLPAVEWNPWGFLSSTPLHEIWQLLRNLGWAPSLRNIDWIFATFNPLSW